MDKLKRTKRFEYEDIQRIEDGHDLGLDTDVSVPRTPGPVEASPPVYTM